MTPTPINPFPLPDQPGLPDLANRQHAALQEMRERHDRIRAALGQPEQIAALRMLLAAEGRSYKPGFDHASTAYLEGRKHVLEDLISFLTTAAEKAA